MTRGLPLLIALSSAAAAAAPAVPAQSAQATGAAVAATQAGVQAVQQAAPRGPGPGGAPVAACPPGVGLQAAQFTPGEALTYSLDLLGAEIGTMEVRLGLPPRAEKGRAALEIRSRARASSFVSTNVSRLAGEASMLLGARMEPLRYHEEVDDDNLHRQQTVEFPPRDGQLLVKATRDGEPEPISLATDPDARDLLSTYYLLRAQPLTAGSTMCAEVYAGRRLWRVDGTVGGKETIETPIGKVAAIRIDAHAVRFDDPGVTRSAHIWVTDDARRLPVVALADVKGRVVRAQLTKVEGSTKLTLGEAARKGARAQLRP